MRPRPAGRADALLLNTAGDLACASAANLFLLLDGALVTPSVASGALPGTMRRLVAAELASKTGIEVVERTGSPEELRAAEEGFLTNALMGIVPLTKVDALTIGTGVPGPITRKLRAELERSEGV